MKPPAGLGEFEKVVSNCAVGKYNRQRLRAAHASELDILTTQYALDIQKVEAAWNERLGREVAAAEMPFRRALWLLHGHQGIYGDDGEMQCAECQITDYKRDPARRVIDMAVKGVQEAVAAARTDNADHDWRRQMEAYGYDSVAKVMDLIAAASKINDRCPGCQGLTLFLGQGGLITCSRIGCKAIDLDMWLAAARREGTRSGVGIALAVIGMSHEAFRCLMKDGQQPSGQTFEDIFGDEERARAGGGTKEGA